jgi:hypothetical protein
MLLFNKSVTLVDTARIKDTDGFATETEKLFTRIPAAYQSVYSNEFYNATAQGIKTDLMIVIADVNYGGETRVIDEETNHTFSVVRSYKNGFNVELTVIDLGVIQGG